MSYIVCCRCGHLNGAHEDTDAFCRFVYTDNSGAEYAKTYSAADRDAYDARVHAIYAPKAEFLCDVLRQTGENPRMFTYADLGAGSGYFVASLISVGVENVVGYEVSESQLELARSMVAGASFRQHSLDQIVSLTEEMNSRVIAMVGVLEHLRNPREVLAALQRNRHVQYLYISVRCLVRAFIWRRSSQTLFIAI